MYSYLKKYSGIQIRIGIHTGLVVAGVISKNKYSYDLWGDTVNVASRMEASGLPGEIHLSDTTFRLLKNKFFFESRGEIDVNGKGKMQTYILKSRIKEESLPKQGGKALAISPSFSSQFFIH